MPSMDPSLGLLSSVHARTRTAWARVSQEDVTWPLPYKHQGTLVRSASQGRRPDPAELLASATANIADASARTAAAAASVAASSADAPPLMSTELMATLTEHGLEAFAPALRRVGIISIRGLKVHSINELKLAVRSQLGSAFEFSTAQRRSLGQLGLAGFQEMASTPRATVLSQRLAQAVQEQARLEAELNAANEQAAADSAKLRSLRAELQALHALDAEVGEALQLESENEQQLVEQDGTEALATAPALLSQQSASWAESQLALAFLNSGDSQGRELLQAVREARARGVRPPAALVALPAVGRIDAVQLCEQLLADLEQLALLHQRSEWLNGRLGRGGGL